MKYEKFLLMTPGPANVPKKVLKAYSQDMIHIRRGPILKRVATCQKNLKRIFKTKETVVMVPSTGSGGLEMITKSLSKKGDHILVINCGPFADHWSRIAKAHGLKLTNLKYKLGQTYELEDVKQALAKNKKIKAIYVQHNETSTGSLQKLEPLGKLATKHKVLLCVDGISGIILNELEFDKWKIDAYVGVSTKSFLMPPGLAFVAFSKKAQKVAKTITPDTYYFDYNMHKEMMETKLWFPTTTLISHIYALEVSSKIILKQGLRSVWKEKEMIRKYAQMQMAKLGFKTFTDEKNQSNSNLALKHPKLKSITKLQDYLEKNGIQIAGGFPDPTSYIRIGFLGQVTKKEVNKIFKVCKNYLRKNKITF